jgi:hypothetical protein
MSIATKLSLNQIAVLSALMVEARELNNAELTELAGATLTGEDRKRLVSSGLVQERRHGRSYAFQLSNNGWSTCLDVLAAQPRGNGAAASAVGTLLAGISRALSARGTDARSFFDQAPADASASAAHIEDRIRTAYSKLAPEPAGWVSLADIRELLDDVPRSDLDAALRRVAVQAGVRLIPVANVKSLSVRDRDAALRFGGEDNHAVAIEAS